MMKDFIFYVCCSNSSNFKEKNPHKNPTSNLFYALMYMPIKCFKFSFFKTGGKIVFSLFKTTNGLPLVIAQVCPNVVH